MRKNIEQYIGHHKNIKFIFTDFFDTIVHRTVHPNYVLRLWAKGMIRQLGLSITTDDLYFVRNEATAYLTKKLKRNAGEISYSTLIEDIYRRLRNSNLLGTSNEFDYFLGLSETIEFRVEASVQFLNTETVETLKKLQSEGLKIYCVSDFYTSTALIEQLIDYHGLNSLFDKVFISSDIGFSKHVKGGIYTYLVEHLGVDANQVLMIGDNHKSDVINAEKKGLHGIHIPNKEEMRKQKRLVFGNDTKDYEAIIKNMYKACNTKKAPPYSDFIILFTLFTEKLYRLCLDEKIKNVFFLAREGLFLKRLFDHYQKVHSLETGHKIKTHYFKISRQAALQVSLKPIEAETFTYFRDKYEDLSINSFLKNFSFSETELQNIIKSLSFEDKKDFKIEKFFESDAFKALTSNVIFKESYESNRLKQKEGFEAYLKSFNVPIKDEGMHLVDVGWIGTMQSELFQYFNGKIDVFGYYLGLKEFKTSIADTIGKEKKLGLNFQVNLYTGYSEQIMMANTELYEQLSQAPHGSTLGYQNVPGDYTLEHYDSTEKYAYDNYIKETQDFMFEVFKTYCDQTKMICYEPETAQEIVTKYALRISTFLPKRKLNRVIDLSKGFFSNIGNHTGGEDSYKMGVWVGIKKNIPVLKKYIISPEILIKYLMRSKLTIYKKNKLFYFPTFPVYYYVRFVHKVKKIIGKKFYLKYVHFK